MGKFETHLIEMHNVWIQDLYQSEIEAETEIETEPESDSMSLLLVNNSNKLVFEESVVTIRGDLEKVSKKYMIEDIELELETAPGDRTGILFWDVEHVKYRIIQIFVLDIKTKKSFRINVTRPKNYSSEDLLKINEAPSLFVLWI